MVVVPRVLLLGALGLAGVALAFLIGARAGVTVDRVMTQSAPCTALLR